MVDWQTPVDGLFITRHLPIWKVWERCQIFGGFRLAEALEDYLNHDLFRLGPEVVTTDGTRRLGRVPLDGDKPTHDHRTRRTYRNGHRNREGRTD